MVMHNGEEMPIDEVANRIRIEQLDPKWKENKERLDARRTQAALLQQGADVSASLRELANARTDMFGNDLDEDARKLQEDAERARRKEKERVIWDGHTASKETTLNKFAQQSNLDEQIAAIHKKAGVATVENTAGPIGPGPAAFPKPAPPQAEQGPTGTISALPQPPSSLPPIPTAAMGSYSSLPAPPSAPSAALPPSIHPSRMAAMQLPDLALGGATGGAPYSMPPYGAPPPPPPGMPMMGMQGAGFAPPPPPSQQQQQQQPVGGTRPREEDGQDGPDAKRARTDGQPVSEAEWLAHNPYPITLSIQLPTVAGKPELDGSVISLSQVGLNLTVGVLRERIQEATKTTLPLSKMRLDTAAGKVLNNKSTLASINLATGDTLTLNIRK
jgi:splicing factor 3A subunit 1